MTLTRRILTLSLLGLFTISPLCLAAKAHDYFPGTAWRDAIPQIAQLRPKEIADLETYLFTRTGNDQDRKGIRTDGVLIIKSGTVLYERYARDWQPDQAHLAWSVTKSFTNALTAVAVRDGKLKVSDSICQYLKNLDAAHCPITVDHLLHFSSGLKWQETYEHSPPTTSSVLAMLYGVGHKDMGSFVAHHPILHPAGTAWAYSTGETSLLAAVVKSAYAPAQYASLPWDEIFNPLQMKKVVWETDHTGLRVGGSYLYATARDFARLGYLYLHDGIWNGKRIFPEAWVKYTTTVAPAFITGPLPEAEVTPNGAQWRLNRPVPEKNLKAPWQDAPEDTFIAIGHWGQYIVVVPSLDLVIVRTGDDRESDVFNLNQFLKLALQVAK